MASVTVVRKEYSRVRPAMRLQVDYWLLLSILGLLIIGLLMVYSTTFDLGLLAKSESGYYFKRQLIAAFIGVAGALIALQFDYHFYRRFSIPLGLFTLLLLIVVLVIGEANFGAVRGLYENSFQPSELAKLATILYIAHWLSSKGDRIKNVTYGLIPFAVITGLVCFLIVQQPDLSTAGLIALISLTMFFVAGAAWRQIFVAGIGGGAIFGALMVTLPHAQARVHAWQEVLRDPNQAIWQVRQALIALANGGYTGVGLGNSVQKFGPLPAAHTDAIFAVLGEELGLLGCLSVLLLLGLLIWRGFRAATMARDSYGFMLAFGITCWLAFQALMNIAVITAVIPFTGIPLPFISYGGTSMMISLFGAGILLNVSRDTNLTDRRQPQPQRNKMAMESPRESIDLRRRNGGTYIPRSRRSR